MNLQGEEGGAQDNENRTSGPVQTLNCPGHESKENKRSSDFWRQDKKMKNTEKYYIY
jgi:hypothetical protein